MQLEEYSIWICPSSAGMRVSRSLSVFAGVSSVSARNAGEQGDCGLGVSRAEEVVGLELRGLEITITVDVDNLGGLLGLRLSFPLMGIETSFVGGNAAGV